MPTFADLHHRTSSDVCVVLQTLGCAFDSSVLGLHFSDLPLSLCPLSNILVCWIWLWVGSQIVVLEPPLRFFVSDCANTSGSFHGFTEAQVGAHFRRETCCCQTVASPSQRERKLYLKKQHYTTVKNPTPSLIPSLP